MIFSVCFFFFFNDTATTEIYTLSLHDALPISAVVEVLGLKRAVADGGDVEGAGAGEWALHGDLGLILVGADIDGVADDARDRKSTRLNSSHSQISYAVFCLKKKTKNMSYTITI